jgi:hypothetical protein
VHPVLRHLAEELTATSLRVFAYIGGLAVIVVVAVKFFGTPAVDAAIEPERSIWANIERPYRVFTLSLPEFAEPQGEYVARRHPTGGRKDVITWGDANGAGSRLRLEIYRPGQEISRFADPATEMVARTADLGGPYGLKPAEVLESKFGRVATFAFTANAGLGPRHCLGFVRAVEDPRLQIAGWYCKSGEEVVDRTTVSCALDRLTLVMAASEPKVTEFFARSELSRKFCNPKPAPRAPRTPVAKRNDWIDAAKEPKLRGRIAGR